MRATLTAMVALCGLMSTLAAQAAPIQGYGAATCGAFIQDVNRSGIGSSIENNYFNWLQGYLSRLNMDREAQGRTPVSDLSPPAFAVEEQKEFVRDYCAENPASLYADAAIEVWNELLRMDGLSS